MIPIILLHHNEFDYLYQALNALKNRTDYPHTIVIVDNNSVSNHDFWIQIKKQFAVNIIFNKNNNWIYGFNLAIKLYKSHLYALSDSDIIVPERSNGICWLTHLVSQLNEYPMIGKIGLSLCLDNIEKNVQLRNTYLRELNFKSGLKIGANVIAPVDTTMALYRSDLFIHNFYMRIGHMRLLRPYYYCVRTSEKYNAIHLGWIKYSELINNKNSSTLINVNIKANFFGLHGILLPKELYYKLSIFMRFKYNLLFTYCKLKNLIIIYFYWLIYFFKSPIGGMNKIQFSARK